MTSIQAPKLGVTKNGNEYQKTTKGRELGTKIGAGYAAFGICTGAYISNKRGLLEPLKSFVKNGPMGSNINIIPKTKVGAKVVDLMVTSKAFRAGMVGAALAVGAAASIALYAGLGRLIGAGVDAIRNQGAKAEADRRAAEEV